MMRRMYVLLLLVAGCGFYSGDMRLVQGIWRIEESLGEDEDRKKESFETQLTIDGHLIIAEGERAVWRFELDEKATPREIELEVLAGEEKGQTHRGIYKVVNDHWMLCIQKHKDKARPVDFEKGEKGSGIFTILLRRAR